MTDYTERRSYPYPSSPRENGHGGLHSELLARKVATDLDTLDASWPAELAHASIVLRSTSGATGLAANAENPITLDIVDKLTGFGLANDAAAVRVVPGGEGWYHIVATIRSNAVGTITAGAQHRLQLREMTPNSYGVLTQRRMRYTETFQQGSTDNFNQLEAVVHLGTYDRVTLWFFHTNTGSLGRVVAGGTRLMATKIIGD